MKFSLLAIVVMLLTSCGWNSSPSEKSASINRSALYDPPTVTLIDGRDYQFVEGNLTGRGQLFYSRFRYLRALVIGK